MHQLDIANMGDRIAALTKVEAAELYEYLRQDGGAAACVMAVIGPRDDEDYSRATNENPLS